jgi:sugar lactone lactonase YvrE
MGLALDGHGMLFIANTSDCTLRRLDLVTGGVTNVSGRSGTPGYNDSGNSNWELFDQPVGLAFDDTNQDLYVADSGNDVIRRIHFPGGTNGAAMVSTLRDADKNPISFTNPEGLVFDGKNALYVAEVGTGRASKVVLGAAPVVSDIADVNGTIVRVQSAFSVALDAGGRLYLSDYLDPFGVYSVFPDVSVVTTLLGSGSAARALGYGGGTRLFIGDEHGLGIAIAGGNTTTVRGIAGSPPAAGASDGASTDATFAAPNSITWDGAKAAYILEARSGSIRRLDLTTSMVETVARVPAAPAFWPSQLTSDHHGNLYFIARRLRPTQGHTIQRLALIDGTVTTIASSEGEDDHYTTLVADDAGSLYAGSVGTLWRINAATHAVTTLAPLTDIHALAWDGAGALFVADGGAIRRVTIADGSAVTLAGAIDELGNRNGTGAAARFESPNALAFDPSTSTLYVADFTYSIVRRLDVTTGTVASWIGVGGVGIVRPGPLPATVNQPSGLAIAGPGHLLLVDENENAVLRVE